MTGSYFSRKQYIFFVVYSVKMSVSMRTRTFSYTASKHINVSELFVSLTSLF